MLTELSQKQLANKKTTVYGGKIGMNENEEILCTEVVKACKNIHDSIPTQTVGGKRKNWKDNVDKIVNMILLYELCKNHIIHRNKFSAAIGIRDSVFCNFINLNSSVGDGEWLELKQAYSEKKKKLNLNAKSQKIDSVEKVIDYIINFEVLKDDGNLAKDEKSVKKISKKRKSNKDKKSSKRKKPNLQKKIESSTSKSTRLVWIWTGDPTISLDKDNNLIVTRTMSVTLKKGTKEYNKFLLEALSKFELVN